MISQELLEKLDSIDSQLKKIVPSWKEQVLARTVKLWEEVWELNNEVLLKFYKRKKTQFDEENMKGEFADVIFTTILLAKSLDIDINECIQKKMEIIEKRGGV